jgi:hypothetical protein
MGGIPDKEACTTHTVNIISQRQYFVARCLSSYVGDVFGSRSICVFLLPSSQWRRQNAQIHSDYSSPSFRKTKRTISSAGPVDSFVLMSMAETFHLPSLDRILFRGPSFLISRHEVSYGCRKVSVCVRVITWTTGTDCHNTHWDHSFPFLPCLNSVLKVAFVV